MNRSLFLGIAMCAAAPFARAADPQDRPGISATAPAQQITRAGEQASTFGSVENFTGRVRVDLLFSPNENINASLAYVTFDDPSGHERLRRWQERDLDGESNR